jgi:hypothetical protein
LEGRQFFLSV